MCLRVMQEPWRRGHLRRLWELLGQRLGVAAQSPIVALIGVMSASAFASHILDIAVLDVTLLRQHLHELLMFMQLAPRPLPWRLRRGCCKRGSMCPPSGRRLCHLALPGIKAVLSILRSKCTSVAGSVQPAAPAHMCCSYVLLGHPLIVYAVSV